MILEDEAGDIVAKVLNGKGITRDQLSNITGSSRAEIDALIDDYNLPEDIAPIAIALELDTEALAQLHAYPDFAPDERAPQQIISPFGHLRVNSWWAPDFGPGILFDAGTDAGPIIDYLGKHDATPAELWITHGHHDHVDGINELKKAFPNLITRGPASLNLDHSLALGDSVHGLTVIDLDGHWPGALGFINEKFVVVGDAYFAGSIGKIPARKWAQGLARLKVQLGEFHRDQIVLPGHGPASSVHIERHHNPFFVQ